MEIPECFYRVSVKALILDDTKTKFLIIKNSDELGGMWELPGGGLNFGVTPQEDLPREIKEEIGVETIWVSDSPSYFVTHKHPEKDFWMAIVMYEATVGSLDFSPSDECVDSRFVDATEADKLNAIENVLAFAKMFDSKNHLK